VLPVCCGSVNWALLRSAPAPSWNCWMLDKPSTLTDPAHIGHAASETEALYGRLRAAARRALRGNRRGTLLQTTVLANEAWIRIHDGEQGEGSAGALAAAALLRNVLVDAARREGAAKRGRGWRRVPLEDGARALGDGLVVDILDLDQSLRELERTHPRAARVVELRYFSGLGVAAAAMLLEVSERTVESEFRLARALLRVRLEAL
jgi:RNA polymerase sigma factor (TIGR02999 family)